MNFTTKLKCIFAALLVSTSFSTRADTVTIAADRDATLIEDPAGALANGSGPALFVGRTGQALNAIRRGLIHFDVAGAIPGNAIIDNVHLNLHLSKSNAGSGPIGVYRVLDDWGEGPSSSSGGAGAAARPGDSTWIHTFYGSDPVVWLRPGGYYVHTASANVEVAGCAEFCTWQSTLLTADVRTWLRAPKLNNGWILIGDEELPQSAQRFDSRESATPEFHPTLTVEFHMRGTP